jgi:hypothetical protein
MVSIASCSAFTAYNIVQRIGSRGGSFSALAIRSKKRAHGHTDDVSDALVGRRAGMSEEHRLEGRRYAGVDELRGGDFAVVRFERAVGDLVLEILPQAFDAERGACLVESDAQMAMTVLSSETPPGRDMNFENARPNRLSSLSMSALRSRLKICWPCSRLCASTMASNSSSLLLK